MILVQVLHVTVEKVRLVNVLSDRVLLGCTNWSESGR